MGMEASKPTEKSQLFVKTSAHLFSDVFMSVPYWFVKTGLFSSWQHITHSHYCRCLRILRKQFFKNTPWPTVVTQVLHLLHLVVQPLSASDPADSCVDTLF